MADVAEKKQPWRLRRSNSSKKKSNLSNMMMVDTGQSKKKEREIPKASIVTKMTSRQENGKP
ncbi:hypothetical protein WN51_01654 [Melipona quadrifasciata]|uniref:Uncharacterized protein n=1 Tax=Melipona quadrifasciata TaxID=166423 RepID=A0A0N0BE52_9HYME|nr:hypothetical protein WN51_01654 [Melipona quadrifasciata]